MPRAKYWLFIVLAVCLSFGASVRYGFLEHDDDQNISHNPELQQLNADNLGSFWRGPHLGLYIPVTYMYWAGGVALSRLNQDPTLPLPPNPSIFHAGNVVLHSLNGCLVWLLLEALGAEPLWALLGALLFVLHPLQVEAVAWITGAKDLLCASFSLLSLLSFLKFIRRDNAAGAVRLAAKREQAAAKSRARALLKAKTKGKKPPKAATVEPAAVQAPAAPAGHPALYYFAAMAFFFFAVLSKPAAVALVAVLLFMALCLSQRPWWWTSAWVVPHAVAATTLILFTTQQQFPEGPALVVEWWQRPIVAGDAWLFYFRKIVAPISFAVDYARRPGVVLNNPWRIAGSVLPYIAGFTLLWQRKRFPLSFIAFTVFSLFVLPNLGFITFAYQFMSTVCDRYAYMAMLAPALLVSRIGGLSLPRVNLVYGVAVAVLAVLGWETTALVQTWANERALFGHSVEVEPGGAVALVALGNDASNHGDWDGAIRYLEQAGHNHPLWARVHNNMGNSYIHKNQWERAVDELKQAIGLFPTYPLALNNLCGAYLGLERWADADAACNQALRFAPDFNMVYENLGYSAFKQGDPAKAERYFRVAVGLAPTEIKPRRNLTSALLAEHKYAEALPELQILTRIAPNDLHIALDLGATLKALGRRPEAMAVYQSFPVRPGDQQAVAALQQAAAE